MIVPSNHITMEAYYSLEHKERYDIVIGEERYIYVYNKSLGAFYSVICSVRVCISHYVFKFVLV